jgi:hypothetical protein
LFSIVYYQNKNNFVLQACTTTYVHKCNSSIRRYFPLRVTVKFFSYSKALTRNFRSDFRFSYLSCENISSDPSYWRTLAFLSGGWWPSEQVGPRTNKIYRFSQSLYLRIFWFTYSYFKSLLLMLHSTLFYQFWLILYWEEHYKQRGCTPLFPAVEHSTPLDRNLGPLRPESFGPRKAHLCPLPSTISSCKRPDTQKLSWVFQQGCAWKKKCTVSVTHGGRIDCSPLSFLLSSLMNIVTKIYVTLNHFNIACKLSSTLLRRILFM